MIHLPCFKPRGVARPDKAFEPALVVERLLGVSDGIAMFSKGTGKFRKSVVDDALPLVLVGPIPMMSNVFTAPLMHERSDIYIGHDHISSCLSRNSTALSTKPSRRSMILRTALATMSEARSTLKRKGLALLVSTRRPSLAPDRSTPRSEGFFASRRNTQALPFQASVASPVAAGKGSCT